MLTIYLTNRKSTHKVGCCVCLLVLEPSSLFPSLSWVWMFFQWQRWHLTRFWVTSWFQPLTCILKLGIPLEEIYFLKPAQKIYQLFEKNSTHYYLVSGDIFSSSSSSSFTEGTYLLNSDRILGKGNLSIVFPLFSEVKSKVIKGESILYLGLELKNHANCDAGNPALEPALGSNCVCPLGFCRVIGKNWFHKQ